MATLRIHSLKSSRMRKWSYSRNITGSNLEETGTGLPLNSAQDERKTQIKGRDSQTCGSGGGTTVPVANSALTSTGAH